MGKGLDRFKRLVDPETLDKVRRGLMRSEIVKEIVKRQNCSQGAAINSVFDAASHGIISLMLQPNGEVLISTMGSQGLPDDPMMPERLHDQIIVDSDVNRILKGKRPRFEGFDKREQEMKDHAKLVREGKA